MKEYYYGEFGRFVIAPFTTRDGNVVYMVHDADWILDREVREGRSAPTVGQFATQEEAREWCDLVEDGKIFSVPHESNFEGWPELKARVQGRKIT